MTSRNGRRPGWSRTRLRAAASLAAASMVCAVVSVSAASAVNTDRAAKIWQPGGIQTPTAVPGHAGVPAGRAKTAAAGLAAVPVKSAAAAWPTGRATAVVPAPAVGAANGGKSSAAGRISDDLGKVAGSAVKVGGLPVTVASADATSTGTRNVSVTFASQPVAKAAGVNGTVFTLSRGDSGSAVWPMVVNLDYASFASAFGGGYADRLKVVELPSCALTTPQVAACRVQTPVTFRNDTASSTLSASVNIPGTAAGKPPVGDRSQNLADSAGSSALPSEMVLAATSTGSGGVGSYTATSLSAEGSWTGGTSGNTGAFIYTYPIATPASPGPAPKIALKYDSGSVDGRTSVTNAQASWIGDGWDYSPGFIERSYQACSQDGITGAGDNCWAGNRLTVSLDGSSTTLVRDDTSGTWKEQSDSGDQVLALTGAANGAANGEAWEIVTPDGTKYYFGASLNLSSTVAANSTWTEPVYCPKSGDGPPNNTCHNSTQGTDSVVSNMAWRWNLDYVIDPYQNLQTYTWTPETNYYDMGYVQGNGTGTLTKYDRGGYLSSIGYGYQVSAAAAGAQPTDLVTFNTAQRCVTSSTFTNCAASNLSASTAPNWPDLPFDQICPSGSACTNYSPTFFSQTRLASISTSVLVGSTYQPVDSWALAQSFPAPQAGLVPSGDQASSSSAGDGTVAVMWLNSIQHTGTDTMGGGSAVTLPATTFVADEMQQRVDGTTTGAAALFRPRMDSITTESGDQIIVSYSNPQCSRVNNTMPSAPDADTMNCFAQYWTPPSATGPILDWFNTYQVTSVTTNDLVAPAGWSQAQVTSYAYAGAAWHRDDSPLTPTAQRTYGQFRGFRTVTTTVGFASVESVPTQTVTTYLQGMDGDVLANGTTRSVKILDSVGDQVLDSNWLAGKSLESDALNGVGGTVETKSVEGPFTFTSTASQAQSNSMPTLVARMAATSDSRTYSRWHDQSWEQTGTLTTYNANGQVATTDVTSSGDSVLPEVCTTTSYATNTTAHMTSYPDEARAIQGPCGSGAPAPNTNNTVSDNLTFYNGSTSLGSISAPITQSVIQAVSGYSSSGAAQYTTTKQSVFDGYGRLTSSTDADNDVTDISYTAPGASPDVVTTINPMGWTSTVTLDPGHGSTLASTDANNELTSETFDGLGRTTGVWSPLHAKVSGGAADDTYSYLVSNTAPTTVSAAKLRDDGAYATTVQLLDGSLRAMQTQAPTVSGAAGRLLTDTHYNSLGQTVKTTATYDDPSSAPGTTIFVPANDTAVPEETEPIYDGMGRVVQSLTVAFGMNQYSTITAYPGMDQTDVTPPVGGTATSKFTDAAGRTIASWTYDTATATDHASDATVTAYTYTPSGHQQTIIDAAGNTWTFGYNLLGQQTTTADPGAGNSSTAYSPAGRLLSTTDGNGTTLSYTYDALGRKKAEYNTTNNAPQSATNQLAAWTYDSLAKGQPTSTITYTNPVSGANDPANTYTQTQLGYTPLYQSTGQTFTVPSSQGALAKTYKVTTNYTTETSLMLGHLYAAEGGLPREILNIGYNLADEMTGFGGTYNYLNTTAYNPQGQVLQTNFGPYGKQFDRTETYDPATARVMTVSDQLQTLPSTLDDNVYTYNQAGNITAEADTQYGLTTFDTQCFSRNQLGELTNAYTSTNGVTSSSNSQTAEIQGIGACNDTAPVAGNVTGGPAPYWDSYTYDALGDLVTATNHDTSVSYTANNVTQNLTYNGYNPANGSNTAATTPDAVQTDTTTGPTGTTTSNYAYFANGAVKTRNGQSFGYTPQGQTASVTNTATNVTSNYTYDANGALLLQNDPAANQTILYLPWGEQITLSTSGGTSTVSGLRYYTFSPDGVTIVRSSAGKVTYEGTTPQGTATVEVDAATSAYTFRYFDPFGNARGTTPASWPDQRTYLGQPTDPTTGLDLLGAREYDPTTGRFLSVDPVLEAGDQRQMNGYSYAADNPVDGSDPTGQMAIMGGNGNGDGSHDCSRDIGNECEQVWRQASQDLDSAILRARSNADAGDGRLLGQVAKFAYHATGASGVVGCATHPSVSGCTQAALTVATVAVTGGESAVAEGLAETAGKDLLETGAKDAAEAGADDAAADAAGSCTVTVPHSFTAPTPVLMGDGSSKPISQVKVGDIVSNADPASRTEQKHRVDAVIVTHTDHDFADVTVATANGDQTIHTTNHHPFYVISKSSFVEAADLKPGDRLETPDGRLATVAAIRLFHATQTTYDLTIDGLHTYYVLAGDTPVLVHNTQCRTADGKFAKSDGTPSRVGAIDERTTLDQLELDGAPVVRGTVTVNVPGVGERMYDGAVQIDGKWYGVETKGGTSPVTPRQQAADAWLNTPGNTATSVGGNSGYTLEGVFYSWVPDAAG